MEHVYCRKCGVELIIGQNWTESHKRHKDRICRPCNTKRVTDYRHSHPEETHQYYVQWYQKYQERHRALLRAREEKEPQKYKYRKYVSAAKRRGIDFNLSFEDFILFWQLPCVYCGNPINKIGLDRIDSNVGYEIGNVVSCCPVCNKMKNNYTKDFFINHCMKVSERMQKHEYSDPTN